MQSLGPSHLIWATFPALSACSGRSVSGSSVVLQSPGSYFCHFGDLLPWLWAEASGKCAPAPGLPCPSLIGLTAGEMYGTRGSTWVVSRSRAHCKEAEHRGEKPGAWVPGSSQPHSFGQAHAHISPEGYLCLCVYTSSWAHVFGGVHCSVPARICVFISASVHFLCAHAFLCVHIQAGTCVSTCESVCLCACPHLGWCVHL